MIPQKRERIEKRKKSGIIRVDKGERKKMKKSEKRVAIRNLAASLTEDFGVSVELVQYGGDSHGLLLGGKQVYSGFDYSITYGVLQGMLLMSRINMKDYKGEK